MARVAGKICLVTGGAKGLGCAEARALVEEGAQVVIADIDEAAGRETANAIGKRAVYLRLDVRDEGNWRQVITDTVSLFGGLNVLVNNAGVLELADVESCTLEGWRRISSVNVEGTFLGIKHALPAIRRTGIGSIINTASSAALQGVPPVPAYSAAKAGVMALTRTAAVHCIQRGDPIRCNVILPHLVDTPMMRAMIAEVASGLPEEQRQDMYGVSPISVAKTVVFLASDESTDLNGASIRLDRGAVSIPAQ